MEYILDALFDPETYSDLVDEWAGDVYLLLSIVVFGFAYKGLSTWWIERDGDGFRRRVEVVGREKAVSRVRTVCGLIAFAVWVILWIVVLEYGAEQALPLSGER